MVPEETPEHGEPVQERPANSSDPTRATEPYPGFGKRHDIFYQYQPPEAESAEPTMREVPPPPPTYQPEYSPDEEYEDEPSGGHKKLIIAVVVLVMLAMGGTIAFLLLGSKKPTPSQTSNQSNATTATNPDQVSTSCYSFILPKPHTQITSSDVCNGTYTSNNNDIVVTPLLVPYDSIDNIIAAWKTTNPKNTIVSQNPANFGAYSAEQIFWNPPGTPNEEDLSVLVLTPPDALNPKYSYQSAPIYGFEIDGRYDSQSSSKTIYDSILSSWVWK